MACDIMVVKIGQRRDRSPKVQEVLSNTAAQSRFGLGFMKPRMCVPMKEYSFCS